MDRVSWRAGGAKHLIDNPYDVTGDYQDDEQDGIGLHLTGRHCCDGFTGFFQIPTTAAMGFGCFGMVFHAIVPP